MNQHLPSPKQGTIVFMRLEHGQVRGVVVKSNQREVQIDFGIESSDVYGLRTLYLAAFWSALEKLERPVA